MTASIIVSVLWCIFAVMMLVAVLIKNMLLYTIGLAGVITTVAASIGLVIFKTE